MLATGYLYVRIPKGFFPQQDTGALTGSIQADQGTSFQAMQQRVSRFVDIVMSDPGVSDRARVRGRRRDPELRADVRQPQAAAASGCRRDRDHRPPSRQAASVPGAVLYLQAAQDLRIGGRAARRNINTPSRVTTWRR